MDGGRVGNNAIRVECDQTQQRDPPGCQITRHFVFATAVPSCSSCVSTMSFSRARCDINDRLRPQGRNRDPAKIREKSDDDAEFLLQLHNSPCLKL